MSSIQTNQFFQLKDYLNQIINVKKQFPSAAITQAKIASLLNVDPSTISRFLSGNTPQPKTLMINFVRSYPEELGKWPRGESTIGRVLTAADVVFFKREGPSPQLLQYTPATSLIQTPPVATTMPIHHAPIPASSSFSFSVPLNPAISFSMVDPAITPLQVIPQREHQVMAFRRLQAAPIVISYRGHLTLKDGEGMVFDHSRFQNLTNHPTLALYPEQPEFAQRAKSEFKSALRISTTYLRYGQLTEDGKNNPGEIEFGYTGGLLVIPGRARAVEHEPVRLEHEYRRIREAVNRGQPILAICGGAARLFNQLHMITCQPNALNLSAQEIDATLIRSNSIIKVKDHNYRRGMATLNPDGMNTGYNVMMHLNQVLEDSHLQAFMSTRRETVREFKANSVHWTAVNPEAISPNFRVNAISKVDPENTKMNSKRQIYNPTPAVEGFENTHGAPIIGVQWHPESYNSHEMHSAPHVNLIQSMAKAGDAYYAKRRMLHELTGKMNSLASIQG
jgi:gamma-glutamyl-gamma-aminobutyrate hydrolase PuuD